MPTEITNELAVESKQWYTGLVDDLKDLITEVEFTSRWTLVEGYHSLGARILQESGNFERSKIYGQEIVQRVALSLGKKNRTIYYAVQFAKTYPDLSLLPEGKNTSWHHIVNKYLASGEEKPKPMSLKAKIEAIRKLLETEYAIANQERTEGKEETKCLFIRYLQDQVEKIINA